MRKKATPPTSIRILFTAAAVAFCSTAAVAQNLNISSDQVTATSGGGFNSGVLTISNMTGIIPSVTIPAAGVAGATAVPNFTFALASTGVTDGSYTFRAGVVIDDDNSARRLEVSIPSITMVFSGSGTTLAGSIATNASINVRGRAADNTTQATTTLSNGVFSFTGNSLSFTAGNQVSEIQGTGGLLADIANAVANNGAFSYKVVLKQTSGPQNLQFGTITGGFSALGCAPSNAFELGSNASSFSGGFGVQGQFRVIAGTFGAAPTPFASTCTTAISSGGGGGGGTPTPAAEAAAVETATADLAAALSGGITPAVLTQLDTLSTSTAAAAASVSSGIANGSVTVATGVQLFASLSSQIELLGTAFDTAVAAGDGAGIDAIGTAGRSAVASLKTLAQGLRKKTVSDSELVQLKTLADGFTSHVANLLRSLVTSLAAPLSVNSITVDTAIAEVSPIVSNLQSAVNDLLTVSGFALDNTLFSNIQNVSQASSEAVLAPLGTQLGLTVAYSDDSAAKTLLSGNVTLLGRLLDIIAIDVGGGATVDTTATQAALAAVGLNATNAASLSSNLEAFVNSDTFTANAGSGQTTLTTTLTSALAATNLTVDATTSRIRYTKGSATFAAFVKSVSPAPALLPDGQFMLADGSTLIIGNELAITLVPAPNDVIEFAEAIQLAGTGGFTTLVSANGSVSLTETASGAVFSSLMSSAALGTGTAASSTTFTAATGDPAASSYRFVVTYKDGTRQEILPSVADTSFFTSVQNAGFAVLVDRVTGGLTIGGFNFRPDFFLIPLTTDDAIYLTTNADTSGVAYRAVDANGDGRTDYQVLTASGVQTVYGLP